MDSLAAQNSTSTRQTQLVSATMSRSMVSFTRVALRNPLVIGLHLDARLSPQLQLAFETCCGGSHRVELALLLHVLRADEFIVVFATTRNVELVAAFLAAHGRSSFAPMRC